MLRISNIVTQSHADDDDDQKVFSETYLQYALVTPPGGLWGSFPAGEVVVSLSAQMMLTKKGDTFGNIICTICTRYVRCCDVVNYRFVSMEIWTELGSPTIVTSSCKKV